VLKKQPNSLQQIRPLLCLISRMQQEEEIVSRIVNGDLAAFKLLVKQYEKLVTFMVNRLVQNKEDTQDICQEVFIKVYRHIGGFKFQSKLSTWIAQIAYSTAINHVKRVSGKQSLTDDIADFENYHKTADTPESILVKKNATAFIHQQIEQLPIHYRTVLTLYHLNEFSYVEIEAITGMPEGTVKNYLFRARKLLKEKLEIYMKYERA
jgi:RNA polymerase sigma-70 factor (ECF subfamily)